MPRKQSLVRKKAVDAGFRSGFEHYLARELDKRGCPYEYERLIIEYEGKIHRYNPDFDLLNGIIVEVKGRFLGKDRAKHLLIKEQYPELDIRFVFQNAKNPITPKSKTTYGSWCDKHGFVWAQGEIPEEWTDG